MSDKKIKKKLVDFIEKCIEKYIDEHLVDLKRKMLNLDGFKSDEEYRNLQYQYTQIKDERENLQGNISKLSKEKFNLEQKQKSLEENLETVNEEKYKLEQKNYDLIIDNTKLREEKRQIEKKLYECEKNLNKANGIIDSMQQEIEEAQKEKSRLEYFSNGYGEIDSMFKTYQQLNEDIRDELQGIFGNADTPVMFFCNALQENHLDNFWDYISNKINSGKIDRNIEKSLCKLFDFCFDMVNNSQQKPLYKRLQVQKGFDFDNTYMIKTADSSQLGNVKEVKLAGYVYTLSNKIVRRSLVLVESED
ncbi:hypothetical protein E0L01_02535 [Megamonas funiformis]|uniref:hypothetical protein n=1 Tax=Megamonas funiformis TaxID=437897 RepID=UPI0014307E52|nr:hypothetical protein [Megamonas funiformis]NJE27644.1 hypothetical protein [Megamonas funiformis]